MQLALASLLLVLSVSFEGPTELNTPQEVRLDVTGLPPFNVDEDFFTQIRKVAATPFEISSPEESEARIRQRKMFFDEEANPALELVIELDKPGVYVIMGPEMAHHRITVGGQTPTPVTTTAAIYVYEKDHGSPPAAIGQALHKLNQEHGIFALAVDQHVTGAPQIAIQAARIAGLPALVLLNEGVVTKIIRRPTTEAHVYDHVLAN